MLGATEKHGDVPSASAESANLTSKTKKAMSQNAIPTNRQKARIGSQTAAQMLAAEATARIQSRVYCGQEPDPADTKLLDNFHKTNR